MAMITRANVYKLITTEIPVDQSPTFGRNDSNKPLPRSKGIRQKINPSTVEIRIGKRPVLPSLIGPTTVVYKARLAYFPNKYPASPPARISTIFLQDIRCFLHDYFEDSWLENSRGWGLYPWGPLSLSYNPKGKPLRLNHLKGQTPLR